MTEHLMVAIWRAPAVSSEAVAAAIVEQWAPEALANEAVEECTVSFVEPDQGLYSREPDAQGLVPVALGRTSGGRLCRVPPTTAHRR